MSLIRPELDEYNDGLALLRGHDAAREVSRTKRNPHKDLAPDFAHPRALIQAEMAERGWRLPDLARRMDGPEHINRMLLSNYFGHPTGDLHLGNSVAHKLGLAFGLSAEVFLDLESLWRERRAAATA